MWNLQHRVLVQDLQSGMSVEVDDLAIASLSISAKMETPNSPLPADWELQVSLRPDRKMLDAVRNGATVTRIAPNSIAPQIVAVSAPVGDLQALQPNAVLQVEGYRQSFNLARPDEGAFLVSSDSTQQVRFLNYIARGDRKLIMAVPTSLPAGLEWTLEIRTRTRKSKPTGPLYIGIWNQTLHSL